MTLIVTFNDERAPYKDNLITRTNAFKEINVLTYANKLRSVSISKDYINVFAERKPWSLKEIPTT